MKGIKKIVLIICFVVAVVFVGISITAVLFTKSMQIDLGETAVIKEENIEITVLSSETTTIEDTTGIALESGDFIKVKVRIKNNNSVSYNWNNLWSFKIDDKYVSFSEHGDDLPNIIEAGKVEEGYLYFEYTDKNIMNYYTSLKAVDSDSASTTKYFFKLK